jgi:hypothetical protein
MTPASTPTPTTAKGLPKGFWICIGIVAALALFSIFGGWSATAGLFSLLFPSSSASAPRKAAQQVVYDPHAVCQNAWGKEEMENADHSKEDVDYFDINLSSGCFSAYNRPPDSWDSWDMEFLGQEPGQHIGFWFQGDAVSMGPFLPGHIPDLRYRPRAWRTQGKGTFRFYRTSKPKQ